MVDPSTALLIKEGLTLAIQSYFSLMKASGATDEEIAANFAEEKAKFDARPHSELTPPPE